MVNGTHDRNAVAEDCGDPECDSCHFARANNLLAASATNCINAGRKVGASSVQAPAHVKSGLVGPVLVAPPAPLTVTLDLADALSVGLSLQLMVRDGRIPAIAAPAYDRVGGQLVAAARVAAKDVGR